ncbi:MAG: Gx transporter family protein [Oscillospiraceae bacterium]|nr:Gx transporter family protein [Oscillospiraceae bacterium]
MGRYSVKHLTLWALLAALALGLSTLDGILPLSALLPLPGVKLGLANIVTLFALYVSGAPAALAILTVRCVLGAVFAGNASALLFSLLGGFCAMGAMILARRSGGLSVFGVSLCGAAAHNAGQIAAAMIVLGDTAVVGYLPFLLLLSLVTGSLTGLIVSRLLRAAVYLPLS